MTEATLYQEDFASQEIGMVELIENGQDSKIVIEKDKE